MLTKLDAINACLGGVGLSPVQSEESGAATEALAAVNLASSTLQSKGWWFNTEYNWKIAPNAEGKIAAPSDAIKVIAWNTSRNTDLTIRKGFIYDKYNHTFNLTDSANSDGKIEFAFVLDIPYNDLPEQAKIAILFAAKRLYAQDEESDVTTYKMQIKDEQDAMVELYVENFKQNKRNAFQNPWIHNNLTRIAGPNGRTVSSSYFAARNSE